VLCTTDGAADSLAYHKAIKESGWPGVVRPTFRPDAVVNLLVRGLALEPRCTERGRRAGDHHGHGRLSGRLEERRAFFKSMGATATDSGVETPYTGGCRREGGGDLCPRAGRQGNRRGRAALYGHMMIEMARMSVEDGLVMQLHAGCYRNHNPVVFESFRRRQGP
jgi:glucuronate isomerase